MIDIYLHQHFFDFTHDAEYFESNMAIYDVSKKDIMALAFYQFDLDHMTDVISTARTKCDRLIVYIKEPFSVELLDLVARFSNDQHIRFFGDVVMNHDIPNWCPAISWFVSPRHYYQKDDWAKDLLAKVDMERHNKQYHFDCLLGTQKPHRDTVAGHYTVSNIQDKILFSYFKNDITAGIWNSDLNIAKIPATWNAIEYQPNYHVALSALIPYEIYNQSYHSIVAESTAFNEFNHVTEKIAKPIMAQRIFVVFAGQYYLRSLRKLGFKTFATVIDESYDEEPCPTTRYKMAWQQVQSLCLQNAITVRQQVAEILEHNRNLFLTSDWHQGVKTYLERYKTEVGHNPNNTLV